MDSQQTWQAENGIINLWERVGITVLNDAMAHGTCALPVERGPMLAVSEPPVSIEDYLIEHRLRPEPTCVDTLTIRHALLALGLTSRAHRYPEWVRAEAWLFMALRIEGTLMAVEIFARAHDLGLSLTSIEHARVRLGILVERAPGEQYTAQRWRLPESIATTGSPADVDPRWRAFQSVI